MLELWSLEHVSVRGIFCIFARKTFVMVLNIFFIVLGIVIVLLGANLLTDGAVAIAERFKVPQIIIGLTIVAIGTSMPEFFVSLVSALKGTPDLAVGNVVGSNIFNALLIVGVSALIMPISILPATVRKDIPFALVASVILMMQCYDGKISRVDAVLLLVVFAIFMTFTLQAARKGKVEEDAPAEGKKPRKAWLSVVYLLLGLVMLIGGSNLFVDSATKVAAYLGVSEAIIGLTIVAGGTSLPELATSAVAAKKGNSGIAIGNVLGSNIFNILLILGVTGLIQPMKLEGITVVDLSMMVISMMLLWLFSFTKLTIERWEGALLTLVFLGYMGYLIVGAV